MKSFKRILALLLTVMTLLSLVSGVTAIGASTTGAVPGTIPAVNACNHNYVQTSYVVTCSTTSWAYTCTLCGDINQDTASRGDGVSHRYVKQVLTEATCTEGETWVFFCLYCDDENYRRGEPLGHDWSEWTVTKEATDTENGQRERTCSRCGEKETESIGGRLELSPEELSSPMHMSLPLPELPADASLTGSDGYSVSILKTVLNTPESGYFKLGDVINFNIQIVYDHPEGKKSPVFQLYDELFSPNVLRTVNFSYGTPYGNQVQENLGPQTSDIQLSYSVTKDDVKKGFVENSAYLVTPDGIVTSNKVIVNLDPTSTSSSLKVSQEFVLWRSTLEYESGETVPIRIKVTNPGTTSVSDITVTDSLSGDPIASGLTLGPKESADYVFNYTCPENPGHKKMVYSTVAAAGKDPDGNLVPASDSSLYFYLLPSEKIPSLTKEVTGTSVNKGFYVEGETIQYSITLANTTGGELKNVDISDPLLGGTLASVPSLADGESKTVIGSYTVTAADVAKGAVKNQATASLELPSGKAVTVLSNKTSAVTGCKDKVSVVKSVISSPKNGASYRTGETVKYQITVANEGTSAISNLVITDSLCGVCETKSVTVNPHESVSVVVSHKVTAVEAKSRTIVNAATARYTDATGSTHTIVSDPVKVRTSLILIHVPSISIGTDEVTVPGKEKHYPDISKETAVSAITTTEEDEEDVSEEEIIKEEEKLCSVTLSKDVTSSPANGTFYTRDETVTYDITVTNTGEVDILNYSIYDVLSDAPGQLLQTGLTLAPGETITVPFSHVVIQNDVDRKYISNSAMVSATGENGVKVNQTDTVNVLCGDPELTVSFTPNGQILELITTSNVVFLPPADTYCRRTLAPVGSDEAAYTLENCASHTAVDAEIRNAVQSASSLDEQLAAWQNGAGRWSEEITALFEELRNAAADDVTRTVILNTRLSFESQMETYRLLCDMLLPDDPIRAAELVNAEYKKFCTDLCALVHEPANCAAEALASPAAASGSDDCGILCTSSQAGTEYRTLSFCPLYDGSASAVISALKKDGVTWTQTSALWEAAYNGLLSSMIRKTSGDTQNAALAEMLAYTSWVQQWSAFLRSSKNDALDAQLMTRAFMDRTVSICSITPVYEETNRKIRTDLEALYAAKPVVVTTAVPTIAPISTPAPTDGSSYRFKLPFDLPFELPEIVENNLILILIAAGVLILLIVIIVILAASSARRRRRRRRRRKARRRVE